MSASRWAVADLYDSGSDGSWAASSGALSCTGTCTPTGHSGVPFTTGSLLLIDGPAYQDVWLSVDATIDSGCDAVGIVFGYQDESNFWLRMCATTLPKHRLYEVVDGTWNLRATTGLAYFNVTNGTPFTMTTHSYGYGSNLAPAGQVGLWCSDSTANSFDNFKVRDIVGPYEVDGRYFADDGGCQVDDSDNNVLQVPADIAYDIRVVRRGFRGDEFVATYKFKWNGTSWPGFVVRWLDRRQYLVVVLSNAGQAQLYRQQATQADEEFLAAGSSASLSTGTWYEAKVVVDDSGGQRLGWGRHLAGQR